MQSDDTSSRCLDCVDDSAVLSFLRHCFPEICVRSTSVPRKELVCNHSVSPGNLDSLEMNAFEVGFVCFPSPD